MLLSADRVRLDESAPDRFAAVRRAGEVLVQAGLVEPAYAEAMLERERTLSTYLGEGFCMPHGTDASRAHVIRAGIAVLRFPDGVDWEGETAYVAIAVASASDEHVAVLQQLADVLVDDERAEQLRTATDPQAVLDLLQIEEAASA
jgi:mannitol PTS system EIICBA or EIICB component